MEPVESEEVMAVGGGCTAGGLAMRRRAVHCTRRGPALPGGDYDFSGTSPSIWKSRTGVELNGHDEKALPAVHRKGLISYGAFVQN